MTALRIGHGYDVHRLVEGRALILGGVTIPWERGLDGHSDADVLTHAVMDALLGAIAAGDIGKLFPDNDAAFHNISSMLLLKRVGEYLRQEGYTVVNIDATLIAQAPKVSPYRDAMRQNIAAALGVDVSQISVKATTEEHCKYTVQGEVAVTSPVFFSYIGVEEVYHGSLSFCGAVCHAGPASGPCAEQRRHPRQRPACAGGVCPAGLHLCGACG